VEATSDGLFAKPAVLDRPRSGFWRRFAASFIDGIVISVIGWILTLFGLGENERGVHVNFGGNSWPALLISAVYFTFFHGRTGQSPGDAVFGIKVVDFRDGTGEPIGYGRAALRWLVSLVSAIALLIGYLWMLWDSEKQTWHDKAAGSVVVKV
jgi:uncharacterized RDD family membrane protein YckC